MSKQNKKGLAFEEATPQQIAAAKQIIDDAAKHRFYVSRIYTSYNAISGKNDAPQTCSSCLRARAREIKKWYDEGQQAATKASKTQKGTKVAKTKDKAVQTPAGTDAAVAGLQDNPAVTELDPNGLPAPAEGVSRIPMEDGTFIDFLPNDGAEFENGVKGSVLTPQGDKVKAGTYKTAQGHDVKVQVGSKATYAENHDDLL